MRIGNNALAPIQLARTVPKQSNPASLRPTRPSLLRMTTVLAAVILGGKPRRCRMPSCSTPRPQSRISTKTQASTNWWTVGSTGPEGTAMILLMPLNRP